MTPKHFGHFPDGTAWIENHPESLDAPGRWYVDRLARTLYLWPRAGEGAPEGVLLPTLHRAGPHRG